MRSILSYLPHRLTRQPHVARLTAFAKAEVAAVTAMFVLGAAGFVFLDVADEVAEGDTRALDLGVLDALRAGAPDQPIGPAWLKLAAADFTAIGSVTVLSLIVLLVAGLFLAVRRPAGALLLVLASGGGVAISQGLKAAFGRERPPLLYHAVEAANPSFPSGHAMLSAVVFLTLGTMAAHLAQRRLVKIYILVAAGLIAALVGLTRIYLGVHWASDVLGGWCVGAAWAALCWLAAWAWERWVSRKPDLVED